MSVWRSLSLEDPKTDLLHDLVMFKSRRDEVAQPTSRQMSTGPARLAQASRGGKHFISRIAVDDRKDRNAEQMIQWQTGQTGVNESRVGHHMSIPNRNTWMK